VVLDPAELAELPVQRVLEAEARPMRATSSRWLIGLVRKSSAPASIPLIRSSKPSRAVMMTMGIIRVSSLALSTRQAVHDWHHDVEQDEVGRLAGDPPSRSKRSMNHPRNPSLRPVLVGCRETLETLELVGQPVVLDLTVYFTP
jgi:hypothetical protein